MRILGAAPGGVSQAAVAVAALAVLGASVLFLAAGPIDTNDFWFHAKAGEFYASEGPWPAADPMLHTAHADAPVQHEWLFGVGIYAVDALGGFPLVRLVHAGWVLLILALVVGLFRLPQAPASCVYLAVTVFLVLAWPRLVQMRPDLLTITATALLAALLFEPRQAPSNRRLAAVGLLTLVWANTHSLFLLGPLLLVAALAGVGVLALAHRWAGLPGATAQWQRAQRLGLALVLMLAVALLNPRGWQQHLTFFSSSRDFGIWAIADEWTPFDPFTLPSSLAGSPVGDLAWALTNVLALCVLALGVVGALRFFRRRDAASLEAFDPVRLSLAVAALIAMAVSVRFLWMALFPLLLLLGAAAAAFRARARPRAAVEWLAAALSVALVAAVLSAGPFRERVACMPTTLRDYVEQPWQKRGAHGPGVAFLRETGLEGHLYNRYTMGGFLGYWLSPRMRTFVDGRTEHYGRDVLEEYFRIARRREVQVGETALEALDRREVDVFFGVGLPAQGENIYTTTQLEGVADWRLVFRAPGHAVYLRHNERNRENAKRIEAYYALVGVPFDPERGIDPDRVIEEAPEWMQARGMLPEDYSTWLSQAQDEDSDIQFEALDALGRTYALLGAYASQARVDGRALALRPRAKGPLRRNVFSALHRGRVDEGLEAARALVRADATDPRSMVFLSIARSYAQRRKTQVTEAFVQAKNAYRERRIESRGEDREEGWLIPPESLFGGLWLMTSSEKRDACHTFD